MASTYAPTSSAPSRMSRVRCCCVRRPCGTEWTWRAPAGAGHYPTRRSPAAQATCARRSESPWTTTESTSSPGTEPSRSPWPSRPTRRREQGRGSPVAVLATRPSRGVGVPPQSAGTRTGDERLMREDRRMPILEELDWRGLIAQSTDRDALAAELAAGIVTVYSGFDPTAPSLHAGHLVPLLPLRRFQQAGHRPIVLAGGATGMIGDPRETGERTLNTADTVADWASRIRGQLERFVEFDESPTGAIVENNLSWTGELSAIEFLRDVGKYFSGNVMLDSDEGRRRIEGDGISYTEFSYMLLQANDYVELHERYGCGLQIGGSDQWGNIVAGARLVRQKVGATVHAMTTPLVTDSEGKKFGKSTGGGNRWLDPEMTSPYALFKDSATT